MKVIDKLIVLELYMQDERNRQKIVKEFNEWSRNKMESYIGRVMRETDMSDMFEVGGMITTETGYTCYLCEFIEGKREGEVVLYTYDKLLSME